MVDWEAVVGLVLMVFPECTACFNLLISCFNLSLWILSSCSNLNDWSCVKALVKLLALGLGAIAAGIELGLEDAEGACVCRLITIGDTWPDAKLDGMVEALGETDADCTT